MNKDNPGRRVEARLTLRTLRRRRNRWRTVAAAGGRTRRWSLRRWWRSPALLVLGVGSAVDEDDAPVLHHLAEPAQALHRRADLHPLLRSPAQPLASCLGAFSSSFLPIRLAPSGILGWGLVVERMGQAISIRGNPTHKRLGH
jgi:hypothetical protein